MKKFLTMMFCACAVFALTSCGGNDTDPDSRDNTKTQILSTYVNQVVVPTYRNLADAAIELQDICADLRENPTQAKVESACNAWKKARVYWEQSEAFLYGAAADYYIDPHIDSWPLKKSSLDALLANTDLIKELDEDGTDADGFATLGYGLLGFHAVEYVIFRDGKARNVSEISEGELIFNKVVAEDLAQQTIRLEAAWAGLENVTKAKQEVLEDAELEPSTNYGELLINAGLSGNAKYKTQNLAIEEVLQGASDISDEVGNTKISDPCNSHNVLDVESWYSWNSIADFADNIRSVRNAYYGSTDGQVATNSLATYFAKNHPAIDTEIREAIADAILKIEDPTVGMPAPFRNHLTFAENQDAIDACNRLMEALDAAIEAL